jgi:hypothetical protein
MSTGYWGRYIVAKQSRLVASAVDDAFTAEAKSIGDVCLDLDLGFVVPAYQRGYEWEEDKGTQMFQDFLLDLRDLGTENTRHTYLGSLILVQDQTGASLQNRGDTKPSTILVLVDGQQRLVSCLLLLAALYRRMMSQADILPGLGTLLATAQEWIQGCFIWGKRRDSSGDRPILIRTDVDKWDTKAAAYDSDIARFLSELIHANQLDSVGTFKPTESTTNGYLLAQYRNFEARVEALLGGDDDALDLEEGCLLTAYDLDAPNAARLFLECSGGRLDYSDYTAFLATLTTSDEVEITHRAVLLALVSMYVINRVSFSEVRCEDDLYALAIFERLNTSGRPLMALDVHRAQAVQAIGPASWPTSKEVALLDDAQWAISYKADASERKQRPRDARHQQVVIDVALLWSGEKIGKDLAGQTRYLRRTFKKAQERKLAQLEMHKKHPLLPTDPPGGTVDFERAISQVAKFYNDFWDKANLTSASVSDPTVPPSFGFEYLVSVQHTLAAPALARIAAGIDLGNGNAEAELERAAIGMACFAAIWKAYVGNNRGIDATLRKLSNNIRVDASVPRPEPPSTRLVLRLLRQAVANRLSDSQGPAPRTPADLRSRWVAQVAKADCWGERALDPTLVKFVLVLAHYNVDFAQGMPHRIVPKPGGYRGYFDWKSVSELTIEHVAPRTQPQQSTWDQDIYDQLLEHRIGNLTLVPNALNSVLSNHNWDRKKWLLRALGANSVQQAEGYLNNSGHTWSTEARNAVKQSVPLPQLSQLFNVADWNRDFVIDRTQILLELAWDTMWRFLEGSYH